MCLEFPRGVCFDPTHERMLPHPSVRYQLNRSLVRPSSNAKPLPAGQIGHSEGFALWGYPTDIEMHVDSDRRRQEVDGACGAISTYVGRNSHRHTSHSTKTPIRKAIICFNPH